MCIIQIFVFLFFSVDWMCQLFDECILNTIKYASDLKHGSSMSFFCLDTWKLKGIYIFVILESKNHNLFIKMCSAFTHWLFIWSIMTRTVLPCISHRCRVKVSVLVCCKCQYWSCIYLVSDQNQNLQYGIALMHNTLIRLDVAYS